VEDGRVSALKGSSRNQGGQGCQNAHQGKTRKVKTVYKRTEASKWGGERKGTGELMTDHCKKLKACAYCHTKNRGTNEGRRGKRVGGLDNKSY